MRKEELSEIDPRALGDRLKQARIDAEITQARVAKELGLARTSIVAIEKGERPVTPHDVISFSKIYGTRVSDLVGRVGQDVPLSPQFRAVLQKSETDALETVARLQRYAGNYAVLEEISGEGIRSGGVPQYTFDDVWEDPEQRGEEIAEEERNRVGLGVAPIYDLREILEKEAGLRIFYFPMHSKISGLFAYNDSLGGCIGINAKHPMERARWTLAHEYAHFITTRFHPDLTLADAAWGKPKPERLADSFSANFLMPRTSVNRHFTEMARRNNNQFIIAHLFEFARHYVVSVQAICLRLESLKRLKRGTWDSLKDAGLRVEHARRTLELEETPKREMTFPIRYRLLAKSAYDRGFITEGQFARFLDTDRLQAREENEKLEELISSEDLPPGTNLAQSLLA